MNFIALKEKIINEFKPKRFVVDGLTALRRTLNEEDFMQLAKMLVSECKEKGVTLVMTMIGDPFKKEIGINTVSDNVIVLSLEKNGDSLIRKIAILKARGSRTTERIRRLSFDAKGRLIIGE